MDSGLDVVIGCDEAFVPGAAVTLASLVEHVADPSSVRVFVLDCGLRDESVEALARTVSPASLVRCKLDLSAFSSLPLHHRFTHAVYAPWLIGEALPSDAHRALMLDADLLVRDDVSKLFQLDFGEAVLAAAPDDLHRTVGDHYLPDSGIPLGAPVFNAGVLLVDLVRWRDEDIGSRALALKRAAGASLPLHDQAVLNTLLWDRWLALHPRWNQQDCVFRRFDGVAASPREAGPMLRDPAIVHFTGHVKPWHGRCGHPFTADWFAAYRRTALATVAPIHPGPRRRRAGQFLRRRFLLSPRLWIVRAPVSRARAWLAGRRVRGAPFAR